MASRPSFLLLAFTIPIALAACGSDEKRPPPPPAATGGSQSGSGGSTTGSGGADASTTPDGSTTDGGSTGGAPGSGGASGDGGGTGGAATGGTTGEDAGSGGTPGSGGSGARMCTLSTTSESCDGCIRFECNDLCLACEDDPDCVDIAECIFPACLADAGGVDLDCAQACMDLHPDNANFAALAPPLGCTANAACGSFCAF